MDNKILVVAAFLTATFAFSEAQAQSRLCDESSPCLSSIEHGTPLRHYYGDRSLMTAAVLQKLTIWVRPSDGSRVYVEHCRRHRHGCEQEVATLVDYIFDVSIRNGFDPWLLVGIAWHESRFNPFAESSEGAFGLLQILRRSPWSRGLPFIHQRWFREQCHHEIGSCQQSIVERSVFWLRRSIDHCGSVQAGLRMYNSGRCDGPRRYVRAVFAAQRDILERARRIAENGFVDPNRPSEGPVFVADGRHICLHTHEAICLPPRFEQYWCSERSLMCQSFGIECECEQEV